MPPPAAVSLHGIRSATDGDKQTLASSSQASLVFSLSGPPKSIRLTHTSHRLPVLPPCLPALIRQSLKKGTRNHRESIIRCGVMPGKSVEKPDASVQKLRKAPAARIPWG